MGADVTIVRPRAGWVALNLQELWHYRELLYFLVWRNIKVRYKQTLLGASWALIQPLATMVVFSVFFGKLAKVPSDGVPYPLFAYCGLLPWQLFSYAMTESSNSVVGNQQLITKVYFPRLVIPISAVISGLVDFAISFSLLLLMMPFYGVMPTVRILVLPLFILFAVATALAIGLWLSALNVEYRDVRYTIPFLTQFWLLLTPVAYPSSLVPAKWRALMGLNPMAGVVEGFRWALLGNRSSGSGALMMVSVVIVIALLFGGIVYFRRMETTFADLV
jgi:lipopolysaccharide transport system permease protein